MTRTIVIAGSLAQKPRQGGHTWQFLNYLLGFRRLGWRTLFLDRLEPDMCVDDAGRECAVEDSVNFQYFMTIMQRFGLEYFLEYNNGEHCWGIPRGELTPRLERSSFLLNVMGFLTDEELLNAAPRKVFLDTDPGFGQMWRDLGQADLFYGHDDYVTIAENIGQSDCTIPTCGLDWITWRQPIVLEQWPYQRQAPGEWFTSIGSWRGPYAPIEHGGRTYGLRAHEFRKFVTLPRITKAQFQVALDIHSAETKDLALLSDNGWSLADPAEVACDPWVYRKYIQRSRAEFMATKGIYVDTHSGWFSERSICYLASGRPVIAQDTGLSDIYPVGQGLLTFSTLDEAAACVEEVLSNYPRHSRAARGLAEEFFDSDKVLLQLLEKLEIATPITSQL
jgi:hypothetical protein